MTAGWPAVRSADLAALLLLLSLSPGALGLNFGDTVWQSPNYTSMSLSLVGVDVRGFIYALDAVTGTFALFDPNGTFQRHVPAQPPAAVNLSAWNVQPTMDPNGTVLVGVSNRTVLVWAVYDGSLLYSWNVSMPYGNNSAYSATPVQLLVDAALRVLVVLPLAGAWFSVNGTLLSAEPQLQSCCLPYFQLDRSSNLFHASIDGRWIDTAPLYTLTLTERSANGSVATFTYPDNYGGIYGYYPQTGLVDDFGVVYIVASPGSQGWPHSYLELLGGRPQAIVTIPQAFPNPYVGYGFGVFVFTDPCGDIVGVSNSSSIWKVRGASYSAQRSCVLGTSAAPSSTSVSSPSSPSSSWSSALSSAASSAALTSASSSTAVAASTGAVSSSSPSFWSSSSLASSTSAPPPSSPSTSPSAAQPSSSVSPSASSTLSSLLSSSPADTGPAPSGTGTSTPPSSTTYQSSPSSSPTAPSSSSPALTASTAASATGVSASSLTSSGGTLTSSRTIEQRGVANSAARSRLPRVMRYEPLLLLTTALEMVTWYVSTPCLA